MLGKRIRGKEEVREGVRERGTKQTYASFYYVISQVSDG